MRMMTTPRKSTTKKNDRPVAHPRMQPNRLFSQLTYRGIMLLAVFLASQLLIFANPPANPVHSASVAVGQRKPAPGDCIFYATVFTDKGNLLEGAEIHVHPNGKKRPDYVAWSDRRGEFAIHVDPGFDYDIAVKADGFVPQLRTVNAQTGRQDLVFHMQLKHGKKP